MATKLETAIIEMKSDLEHIKLTTDEIKSAVFGNGSKGLKTKVVILEVKFWIIIILSLVLLAPISVGAIKGLMGG